jgi:hypothetical protein
MRRMEARMIDRVPGSSGNPARSASNASSPGSSTSPLPYRRRILGRPSNAQNMKTMRPFCFRWAMVSTPLPVRSR